MNKIEVELSDGIKNMFLGPPGTLGGPIWRYGKRSQELLYMTNFHVLIGNQADFEVSNNLSDLQFRMLFRDVFLDKKLSIPIGYIFAYDIPFIDNYPKNATEDHVDALLIRPYDMTSVFYGPGNKYGPTINLSSENVYLEDLNDPRRVPLLQKPTIKDPLQKRREDQLPSFPYKTINLTNRDIGKKVIKLSTRGGNVGDIISYATLRKTGISKEPLPQGIPGFPYHFLYKEIIRARVEDSLQPGDKEYNWNRQIRGDSGSYAFLEEGKQFCGLISAGTGDLWGFHSPVNIQNRLKSRLKEIHSNWDKKIKGHPSIGERYKTAEKRLQSRMKLQLRGKEDYHCQIFW